MVHAVVFAVGLFFVFGTGTWSGLTFLYNDADNGEPNALQWFLNMQDADDVTNMTRNDHARYIFRALASIFGQVCGQM